jgi:tyrosinase
MLVPFTFLLWVLCAVGIVDAQNYPITGVKVAAGQPVPYRKNINQLRNEGGPAWDLYNRALADMYKQSPSDRLSFFQIAGGYYFLSTLHSV